MFCYLELKKNTKPVIKLEFEASQFLNIKTKKQILSLGGLHV